jgi:hypothetical protein
LVLLLALCWDLEDRSFISKGKGSLRQRDPRFMQNQTDPHTLPLLRTPPKPQLGPSFSNLNCTTV